MAEIIKPGETVVSPDTILKLCDDKHDALQRLYSCQKAHDEAQDKLEQRKTEIIIHDLRCKSGEDEGPIVISGSNDMIRNGQMEAATVAEAAAVAMKEKALNAAKHDLELIDVEFGRIELLLRNVGR